MGLRIETHHLKTCHVILVEGEVDVAPTGALLGAVYAACERRVALVLSGLEFIDARGLAALIRADSHLRRRGGSLLLVDPAPCLRRLLRVTGLEHRFATHTSVQAALGGPPALAGP
jgi:anti-sigma B factor antagonist